MGEVWVCGCCAGLMKKICVVLGRVYAVSVLIAFINKLISIFLQKNADIHRDF